MRPVVIPLRKIADLEVSAASAIVVDGPKVYVVADDEASLDGYLIDTGRRVLRLPLLDRALPTEPAARKAAKPDFEALAWLPGGLLLVLPSGSTPRRQTGVLLMAPDRVDGPPREPREFDLAALYGALRTRFADLNIEGAAAAGGVLRLLSRGGAGRDNAVIDLDLEATVDALLAGASLRAELVRAVRVVSLGSLDGVALGFTDAAPLNGTSARIAFAAAAEDTDNPYDDGPCVGSVIGVLEADGRLAVVERVDGRHKIEGLAVTSTGLLMVADPDDPTRRAPLFEASWSLAP